MSPFSFSNALNKVQTQIDALKEEKKTATKKEAKKIQGKINRIIENAHKRKNGTEHSTDKKR